MSSESNAEELAAEYEKGDAFDKHDYDKVVQKGGSGKQRTKQEQAEHKHHDSQGDTRKIVQNILNSEEKRREEERQKNEKKGSSS